MRFKVIVLKLLMAILLEAIDIRQGLGSNVNLGSNLERQLIKDAHETINELEADENVY